MRGICTALENGTREGIENATQNALKELDKYEVYSGLRPKIDNSAFDSRHGTKFPVQSSNKSEYTSKCRGTDILLFLLATIISQTGVYYVSASSMGFIMGALSSDKMANPYFATTIIAIFWSVQIVAVWKLFKVIQTTYFEKESEVQIHANFWEQIKTEMEVVMLQELETIHRKWEEQMRVQLEQRMQTGLSEIKSKVLEEFRNLELSKKRQRESDKLANDESKPEHIQMDIKETMRMALGVPMYMALGALHAQGPSRLNDTI